jgi:riboflavin-specific deaminase-like protein
MDVWTSLLELARLAGEGRPRDRDGGLAADARTDEERALCAIYLPLCLGEPAARLVLGHLAQTLDGRIATVSGKSQFISSEEDLVHAHRLRALSDVVLIGRRTVREDDPQLTTRHVSGPSPVRAILDPDRTLAPEHRVFSDGATRTLLFCRREAARGDARHGQAELIAIDAPSGRMAPAAILGELRARGLRRVYLEGGGVTISRFVEARALTRLHVTVAPRLFGSGRPSLTLPEIGELAEALPLAWRTFALGRDVLFDCTFA